MSFLDLSRLSRINIPLLIYVIAPDTKVSKKYFSLFLNKNIHCVYSSEMPHQDIY